MISLSQEVPGATLLYLFGDYGTFPGFYSSNRIGFSLCSELAGCQRRSGGNALPDWRGKPAADATCLLCPKLWSHLDLCPILIAAATNNLLPGSALVQDPVSRILTVRLVSFSPTQYPIHALVKSVGEQN